MKLGLVNAGLPAKVSSCLRTCAYPPLSIVYLASFLRRQLPRLELVLVDDQLGDDLRFNDLDCCDLIGISANSITYPRAIEIAESIKCTAPAALIVLGGIHGTVMWRQVLTNKPCFDYVVLGQGEVALLGLLVGTPVSAIPNLSYREGDESRRNPFQFVPIESIPPPDFTLLEHSSYSRNFRKHYGNKSGLRSAAFTSSTGCAWREASGGCAFCSIPPIRHSRLSPCRFWTHVQVVQTAAHADFLWDVSDTFTSDATWVGQVGEAKPSATDVSFHVYARANDLADARLLGALRRIGVVEALVGADRSTIGFSKPATKESPQPRSSEPCGLCRTQASGSPCPWSSACLAKMCNRSTTPSPPVNASVRSLQSRRCTPALLHRCQEVRCSRVFSGTRR